MRKVKVTSEFSSAIGFGHHNLRKQGSDVAPLGRPTNHKQFDVYMNLPETKVLLLSENALRHSA